MEKDIIEKFTKERDKALLTKDRATIQKFYSEYIEDIELPADEMVFKLMVHKAICNCTSIPKSERWLSERWLKEHGSTPDMTWTLGCDEQKGGSK